MADYEYYDSDLKPVHGGAKNLSKVGGTKAKNVDNKKINEQMDYLLKNVNNEEIRNNFNLLNALIDNKIDIIFLTISFPMKNLTYFFEKKKLGLLILKI